MTEIINSICTTLIAYGADNLMVIMIFVFFIGVILKILMYYLLKAEANFSSAFETRAHRFLNREYQESRKPKRFHEVVDFILNKTFNESYVARKDRRKRKEDSKVAVLNKMFLVEIGAKSLIDDTLKQTKYHDNGRAPDFKNIVTTIAFDRMEPIRIQFFQNYRQRLPITTVSVKEKLVPFFMNGIH